MRQVLVRHDGIIAENERAIQKSEKM